MKSQSSLRRYFIIAFVFSVGLGLAQAQDILTAKASLGTPVRIMSFGSLPMAVSEAAGLDKNRLVYAYQDAENPTAGQVRIITAVNGTLSLGAPATFATTLEPKHGSSQSTDLLVLSPKHFFVVWQQTGTPWGMGALGTVNGDRVAMSDPIQITPNKGEFMALARMNDTTFVRIANDASRRRGTARLMTIAPDNTVEMGDVIDFVIGTQDVPGYVWNTVATPLDEQHFVTAWRSPKNNQGVVAQMGMVANGSIMFTPALSLAAAKTYPSLGSLGGGRALLLNFNQAQGQTLTAHVLENQNMKLVQTATATVCSSKADLPRLATRPDGSFVVVFRDRENKNMGGLVTGKVSADGNSVSLGQKQTLNPNHTVPGGLVWLEGGQLVVFYWEPGTADLRAVTVELR